jgi:hypothetical protein
MLGSWGQIKPKKAFSVPFWKRVVMCFGKKLWVYHNVISGEIESTFQPPSTSSLRIPLASVTGSFGLPPNPAKFQYMEIRDEMAAVLATREVIEKYVQQQKGEIL